MRQAVHWGQVLVDTGPGPHGQVLPIAETLAEPVRLLGQAAPGEILVTASVRRLVEGWFELQPCEKSVLASTVVGLKPQRSPLALHGQRPLSRFVGRGNSPLLAELLGQAAEAVGTWWDRGTRRGQVPPALRTVHSPQTRGWRVLESAADVLRDQNALLPSH